MDILHGFLALFALYDTGQFISDLDTWTITVTTPAMPFSINDDDSSARLTITDLLSH